MSQERAYFCAPNRSTLTRWLGGSWYTPINLSRSRRFNGREEILEEYENPEVYSRAAAGLVCYLRSFEDLYATLPNPARCISALAKVEYELLRALEGRAEWTLFGLRDSILEVFDTVISLDVPNLVKKELLNLKDWYSDVTSTGILSKYSPRFAGWIPPSFDFDDISNIPYRLVVGQVGFDPDAELPCPERLFLSILDILHGKWMPDYYSAIFPPKYAASVARKYVGADSTLVDKCVEKESSGSENEDAMVEDNRNDDPPSKDMREVLVAEAVEQEVEELPAVLRPSGDYWGAVDEIRAKKEELGVVMGLMATVSFQIEEKVLSADAPPDQVFPLIEAMRADVNAAHDAVDILLTKLRRPYVNNLVDSNLTGLQNHDPEQPATKNQSIEFYLNVPSLYKNLLIGKSVCIEGKRYVGPTVRKRRPYTIDDIFMDFYSPTSEWCRRCQDTGPLTFGGRYHYSVPVVNRHGTVTIPVNVNCCCGKKTRPQMIVFEMYYKGVLIAKNQLQYALGYTASRSNKRRVVSKCKSDCPIKVLKWTSVVRRMAIKKAKRLGVGASRENTLIRAAMLKESVPYRFLSDLDEEEFGCYTYALQSKSPTTLVPQLVRYHATYYWNDQLRDAQKQYMEVDKQTSKSSWGEILQLKGLQPNDKTTVLSHFSTLSPCSRGELIFGVTMEDPLYTLDRIDCIFREMVSLA